jgi:fumarylpyruvate hydrolase
MQYVIVPTEQPSVAVAGHSSRFPVRRIFCVGQNYADHAREMGADPDRKPPFFFCKPADAAHESGTPWPYPSRTTDLHHEIELVVALARGGREIAKDSASDCIFGYAVGIDWTRRDLQAAAKKDGRPWDAAKGFDHAATLGPIHPRATVGHIATGRIWLAVDDVIKQNGDVSQLIWSVPEVIAELSTLFELRAGDLIYTGTPAGVGAVRRGQRVTGGIDGLGEISATIV